MPGERVLVVDDNPGNLRLTSYLLKIEGYDARTATNADEAQQCVDSFRPDLVLMDLQMPGVGGLELTRRLKAEASTRDILVVAVTASAMKGDEEKARAAGCDGYVTKPIDTRTLPAVISELLRSKRSQSEPGW